MVYADPDYDPVKAHEYYMKHRKLKGRRRSQRKFTEQQKEQYAYVGDQLREQRRKTVSEGIQKENDAREKQLEQITKTRNAQRELLVKNARKRIELIKLQIKRMSPDQKERMAGRINSAVEKIHERLSVMTDSLNERAKEDKKKVRETAKENKRNLRSKAKADYEDALDKAYERIKG